MNQEQRNEKHLEMMEDFSDVIVKHFPNFDNNIEDSTWAFLVLFTEETIHQLGRETKKLDSTCTQCGDDNDLFTAFTAHKVCWKCTKKNHKKATK
jgi:hypothetical protein